MANLIPQYQIPHANLRPLDFSSVHNFFQNVQRDKQIKAERQRKMLQDVQNQVAEYNPGKLWHKEHQKMAAEEIEQFDIDHAKALTYESDGKGGFLNKLKQHLGPEPSLSDQEYVDLMHKASQLGEKYQKWVTTEQQANKEVTAYKANPDKYDGERFKIYMDHYDKTGEWLGSAIDVASVNPYEFVTRKELDPRTDEQKMPIETPTKGGNYIKSVIQGADPVARDRNYLFAAKNDPGFQKGLVDAMMKDTSMSTEDKIEFIKGTMAGAEIASIDILSVNQKLANGDFNLTKEEKAAIITDKKAREIVDNYEALRNFDPYLIDAATYYGSGVLKINELIGKGSEWEKLNPALYNDQVRRARDKAEEEVKEKEKSQVRTIQIPGTNMEFDNAVDLSTIPDTESQKRSLNGFTLPKGAIKVKGEGGETTLEKKFDELGKQGDYIIDWFDKKADFMQLHSEDGYYIVPIRGNEYILKKISSFEQPKQTEKKTGRYD